MLGSALLLALVGFLGHAHAAGDWVTLFDGKTLDGWVQRNGTASYRVVDGAIVGRTSEGSPNSFLTTEQEYGDFELEFEVRVDDALNSGVQIRSRTRPRSTGEGADDVAGRVFGPQVEIEASPGLAGFIYGEATGRGWLTPEKRLVWCPRNNVTKSRELSEDVVCGGGPGEAAASGCCRRPRRR